MILTSYVLQTTLVAVRLVIGFLVHHTQDSEGPYSPVTSGNTTNTFVTSLSRQLTQKEQERQVFRG